MNGYTFTMWILCVSVVLLSALIWLANGGNTAALVVLTIIGTVLLISFGVGITFALTNITDKREHGQNMERIKMRIDMMDDVQELQNRQAIGMARQIKMLPAPVDKPDIIDVDATLFADFDEVEK